MKAKVSVFVVVAILGVASVYASEKVIKFRAESIMCGGCAGKIKKVVSAIDGVSEVTANQESKVVTVTYDDAKATPQQFKDAIIAAKHTVEDYDPNVVIPRKVSFWTNELKKQADADLLKEKLSAVEGVISIAANAATHSVDVEYNAEIVPQTQIKKEFLKYDFTASQYWEGNERVKYAAFKITNLASRVEDLEKQLTENQYKWSIWDYSLNSATQTIAIAYNPAEASEDTLKKTFGDAGYKLSAVR
jgi:copper chaperone CopZ